MEAASPEKSDATSIWPTTEWSATGHLRRDLRSDAEGLERLVLRYQVPLKIFLHSSFQGLKENQAEELLQDFAQDKLLKQDWLEKPERSRGRFRDFIKTCLKHFVTDRLRARANAPVSLDALEIELPAEAQGESAFDLSWARTILADVLQRMERDCKDTAKEQPRRGTIWEVFRLRLLQPALEDIPPASYEELVRQFAIVSPFDAQNMLATAKRIFTRHLNDVIGEYEQGEESVKLEIGAMKEFLGRLGKKKGGKANQE